MGYKEIIDSIEQGQMSFGLSNISVSNISMDRMFEWCVLSYISVSQTYEWHVGEGPLFWYRIEWKKSPPACDSTLISYTDLINIAVVKGDIIPNKTKVGEKNGQPVLFEDQSSCDGQVKLVDVSTGLVWVEVVDCGNSGHHHCPKPKCDCHKLTEVWHMLATSVPHLCQRILQECQGWHGKVIAKLQKFDRPALCCDVDRWTEYGLMASVTDTYKNVPYKELCTCDCASFIDPCKCNNVAHGMSVVPPQEPKLRIFGINQPVADIDKGFKISDLKVVERKQQDVLTKCCGLVPANLKLKHNLNSSHELNQFLSRKKLTLPESFEILFAENTGAWQKTYHLEHGNEKWTFLFDWSCTDQYDPGNYGWKYHLYVKRQIDRRIYNTRIMLIFASHGTLDKDNLLSISFNVNVHNNAAAVSQPVAVKYKIMTDEIGLFKKDPYFVSSINVI